MENHINFRLYSIYMPVLSSPNAYKYLMNIRCVCNINSHSKNTILQTDEKPESCKISNLAIITDICGIFCDLSAMGKAVL